MRKAISMIALWAAVQLFAQSALADCIDLGNSTSWVREDEHTVVFYRNLRPLARITVGTCTIRPDSTIRLDRSYVCDADSLLIDNESCSMITVESLSAS